MHYPHICPKSHLSSLLPAQKLLDLRDRLAQQREGTARQEFAQENKLLQWLNTRSLLPIPDGFRCIDHMAVADGDRTILWTTETTQCDEIFFSMPGVSCIGVAVSRLQAGERIALNG